jgi:HEAT repeat protein
MIASFMSCVTWQENTLNALLDALLEMRRSHMRALFFMRYSVLIEGLICLNSVDRIISGCNQVRQAPVRTVKREARANSLTDVLQKNNEAVDSLVSALKNSDNEILRAKAASGLAQCKSLDKKVLDALITSIREDTSSKVRVQAVDAFSQIGICSDDVLEVLLEALLEDENPIVRRSAAHVFGHLHVKDERAVSALITAHRDVNESVRIRVMEALGSIGLKDDRIITILTDFTQDQRVPLPVREHIAVLLNKLLHSVE